MPSLELLAPARNADIGIAAIDCGADAVYIAGPFFGARKDAGNPVGEIDRLCSYAHRFGAKIFVTFNISVRDDELEELHSQMLAAQEAGADAFIIRDERICGWKDITVPLHASTQCAIRTPERALRFERLGCSRIVLERELSLDEVRAIRAVTSCEIEFFVHGALCVCYSGECRLSENVDGRSADRGECIQACRSLYDLADAGGKVLVRNKALLSLKDFNLLDRMEEMADAGVMSFKIEGRLKNATYVKNVVRAYSLALDELVRRRGDKFRRASFGRVTTSWAPDLSKTFNRGYTELFLNGKKERGWSSMDAPKSMGEFIGTIVRKKNCGRDAELAVRPAANGLVLHNGDGFSFIGKDGPVGFRGDVCNGLTIRCKDIPGLREGLSLYRNMDSAFEKSLENGQCRRELDVRLDVGISRSPEGRYEVIVNAFCEDGRSTSLRSTFDTEEACNQERARALLRDNLSKRVDEFSCRIGDLSAPDGYPLLGTAAVNALRREAVASLAQTGGTEEKTGPRKPGLETVPPSEQSSEPLMRSRYCIRYELGMCPVHQGAADSGPLFLLNNGRRLRLRFDCRNCEMTVEVQ